MRSTTSGNTLGSCLRRTARRWRSGGAGAIFAFGVLIIPLDLGSSGVGPSPWGAAPVLAQNKVDVSNGNDVTTGPAQSQSNNPQAQTPQQAPPALGQATGAAEVSRGFKLARREYEKQIRRIRFKYFAGNKKNHPPNLKHGFAELAKFTDATAVEPLIEILRDEGDDVREWLLEHLQSAVAEPYGQATLTWLSIYDPAEELRTAARAHLTGDANQRSQYVIDQALRLTNHELVNSAAVAAGKFRLIQAIPLLIATQAQSRGGSRGGGGGALAFVQFQTQSYFVSDLQPVVGTGSAGFDPQLSTLQEGTVMVIQDAVVNFVRPQVHQTLLELVREDYGEPINFGYDYEKWRAWYNNEYLPFKKAQAAKNATVENAPSDG